MTILGPSLVWRKDAFGHAQHPVNVAVDLLWPCIAPDDERSAIGGRQSTRDPSQWQSTTCLTRTYLPFSRFVPKRPLHAFSSLISSEGKLFRRALLYNSVELSRGREKERSYQIKMRWRTTARHRASLVGLEGPQPRLARRCHILEAPAGSLAAIFLEPP